MNCNLSILSFYKLHALSTPLPLLTFDVYLGREKEEGGRGGGGEDGRREGGKEGREGERGRGSRQPHGTPMFKTHNMEMKA